MTHTAIIALLKDAYELFRKGDQAGYDARMDQARKAIDDKKLAGEADWRTLRGEWTLLTSLPLLRYPKLLADIYKKALELLNGKSETLDYTTPFTLGFDGTLGMFLTKSGAADETAVALSEAVELYERITDSGVGTDVLFQAELCYYRGKIKEAEMLVYKVLYIAENTRQRILSTCAAKLLAHIALHNNDERVWEYALITMDRAAAASKADAPYCARLVGLIKCELASVLADVKQLPDWFTYGDFGMSRGGGIWNARYSMTCAHLDFPTGLTALFDHMLYLVLTEQFSRAMAVYDVWRMLKFDDIVLLDIYFAILRSICLDATGEKEQAVAQMRSAIELIEADGLYLILAEFMYYPGGLIEEALKGDHLTTARIIKQLGKSFVRNIGERRESIRSETLPAALTYRERAVAELAAQGLRNREIGERLNITERTVKFHLGNAYGKLQISSRMKLAEILRKSLK